jgi:alkanal monooxygenase alpha chain
MKWGLFLTTAQPPDREATEVLDTTVRHAEMAEKMGFESAWLLEHHFTKYGLVGSTTVLAAHILSRTKSLKVGTAINVIPLQHPIRVAEEVALLDQLSKGRFILGIGRGFFDKDYHVLGVDMAKNREMLEEWTDILIRTWTTGKAAPCGPILSFPEVEVYPEVFTRPRPNMYAVAQSPSTTEWAARLGLPLIMNFVMEDDEKASQLELYNSVARASGHDTSKIEHALSCITSVGRDSAAAKQNSKNYLCWWLDECLRITNVLDFQRSEFDSYEYHRRKWKETVLRGEASVEKRVETYIRLNPMGTPDECVRKLQKTVDITGLKKIICGFESIGSAVEVEASMKLFSEEVMPHVKARHI